MPTMYHAVECVANEYNIPDYVMDIIYMYINRNMIKSCTDEFTNPIFIKHINRMMKGQYKTMGDRNSFRKTINHGRLMLRLLYPKSLTMGVIQEINSIWVLHGTRPNGPIEALPSVNGLTYNSVRTYRSHTGYNFKVNVEVDELFANEMHPTMTRYHSKGRTDMIEVIDYYQQSLSRHGIYGEEARLKEWTPKYPKNKKNEFYVNYLMPQVSDYKRDR